MNLAHADVPLVGCVTRLTHQKGIHLIKHAAWRALERGGQFVLLGSAPEPAVQAEFNALAADLSRQYPDRVKLWFAYDEPLSHLIYAGSDMLLMIAMRYGTVPVVRRTGGLADTVMDVDHDQARRRFWNECNRNAAERAGELGLELNGFSFDSTDTAGMDYALNRALTRWYGEREWWNELARTGMLTHCGATARLAGLRNNGLARLNGAGLALLFSTTLLLVLAAEPSPARCSADGGARPAHGRSLLTSYTADNWTLTLNLTLTGPGRSMVMQSDGKIVHVDNDTVVRRTSDGALDATWSTPTFQADGKILVAERVDTATPGVGAVYRLYANGSRDTSFGVGGKVDHNASSVIDRPQGITGQCDGSGADCKRASVQSAVSWMEPGTSTLMYYDASNDLVYVVMNTAVTVTRFHASTGAWDSAYRVNLTGLSFQSLCFGAAGARRAAPARAARARAAKQPDSEKTKAEPGARARAAPAAVDGRGYLYIAKYVASYASFVRQFDAASGAQLGGGGTAQGIVANATELQAKGLLYLWPATRTDVSGSYQDLYVGTDLPTYSLYRFSQSLGQFVVEVKALTTGVGINCSLWTLDAKAAYEAAILGVANATGSVAGIVSLCRQLSGTAAGTAAGQGRGLLQAAAATTLEITHLLRTRGSLAAAQQVVSSTAAAVEGGQFAAAVQMNMGGSAAFKPLPPPTPNPSCIVGVTCRRSPPPPPPAKKAVVVADPHIYDFMGRKRLGPDARGSPAPALRSLSAKLSRWAPQPSATIMTSVAFEALGATVAVTQARASPAAPYRLAARVTAANGTVFVLSYGARRARVALPGGLVVAAVSRTQVAARAPALQCSVYEASWGRRAGARRAALPLPCRALRARAWWRCARQGVMGGKTMGYLNAIVVVRGALPAPVGGVLGPSYVSASMRAKGLSTNSARMVAAVKFAGAP
eukprot:scaffold10.g2310.t1